jgi:hypothetical protein
MVSSMPYFEYTVVYPTPEVNPGNAVVHASSGHGLRSDP